MDLGTTLVALFILSFMAALAIPVIILGLEILAALVPSHRTRTDFAAGRQPRTAVLVPAHNEDAALLPTLRDIMAQRAARDRIVVVADNCDDDTASVARAAGAEVAERRDPDRRGKGYALDFGIRYLSGDPPEIVIVIDADCRLAEGALDVLARTAGQAGRPAQAVYLMMPSEGSRISHHVAEFAWRVKNWVRPLGLKRLGLPCQLVGTGMAFPWELIAEAELASGRIVEDLKLGLDLAAGGHPAVFCPDACVTSRFPVSAEGAKNQRQRWEYGHIGLIVHEMPRLIGLALMRRNFALLVLALDLAVPPLTLFALLLVASFGLSAPAFVLGISYAALAISTASLLGFGLAIGAAWWGYGRDVVSGRDLLQLWSYATGKLPLYIRGITRGRNMTWVRTAREHDQLH